jgi:hypothetical protein
LPPGQALDALFAVRCRADEKRRFKALAESAGLTLTAWARRMLLAAADRGGAAPRATGKPRTAAKRRRSRR